MTKFEEERKQRITMLQEEIQLAQEEITNIQESCEHSEYRLGKYSWRIGNVNVRRICNICDKVLLTYPTDDELEQFKEEDNDGQGKKIYYLDKKE